MHHHHLSDPVACRLRQAQRGLIANAGGGEAAAAALGASPSRAFRLNSEGQGGQVAQWARVDEVLQLETAAGVPVMTQALAAIQGYRLVPVEIDQRDHNASPLAPHAAKGATLMSTLVAVAVLAEQDGTLDAGERSEIKQLLAQIEPMLERVRRSVAHADAAAQTGGRQ